MKLRNTKCIAQSQKDSLDQIWGMNPNLSDAMCLTSTLSGFIMCPRLSLPLLEERGIAELGLGVTNLSTVFTDTECLHLFCPFALFLCLCIYWKQPQTATATIAKHAYMIKHPRVEINATEEVQRRKSLWVSTARIYLVE